MKRFHNANGESKFFVYVEVSGIPLGFFFNFLPCNMFLAKITPMTTHLNKLLVVEDDPDYTLLFKRAFNKCGIENPIDILPDGEKAISYLNDYVEESADPKLALILMDLNSPENPDFKFWIGYVSKERLSGYRLSCLPAPEIVMIS